MPAERPALRLECVGCTGEALRASALGAPLTPRRKWRELPEWLTLPHERGAVRLCDSGHRLNRIEYESDYGECYWCEKEPEEGASVLICIRCYNVDGLCHVVCEACNRSHRRLPSLQRDPLFHGPRSPALLLPPHATAAGGEGTVIVCAGGNYEYLAAHEAWPVAQWLESAGIAATVLRYRLLPSYGLDDALDDLESAAARARELRPGPVCAIGFSAGAHLIAALGARAAARAARQPLDAAVVVYPTIDASEWADAELGGFSRAARAGRGPRALPTHARTLIAWNDALLGRAPVGAPPTLLVSSTTDTMTPPKEHSDRYAAALRAAGVPLLYLRRDYGEHGFQLGGGWTDRCVRWLRALGFGAKPARKKRARA